MGNVRVYELSRELDKSNKEILNVAMGLGISVKSHASSISTEEARKITDKINSTDNNDSANQDKKTEEKEKVRVFKSDSGAEVVERRKGSRVVLRRKKKTIEPEAESEEKQPDEQAASEQVSELQGRPLDEETGTAASPDTQRAEKEDKAAYESVDEEVLAEPDAEGASETIEDEATLEAKQADVADSRVSKGKSLEQDDAEDKSKKFKKSKKGKIKKEEIIDEDTLEELRKAFSTKLPGRRREYLVEDKRPRNRPGGGGQRRDRPFDRRNTQLRGKSGEFPDTDTSEAAVFPAKPGKKSIKIGETINVGELAKLMGVKSGELIKKLLMMGVKATINEVLDHETAVLIAEEFDCEVTVDIFEEDELLLEDSSETTSEDLTARPPVVTVMGHVDHGKTTLLDAIRETNVVSGEAGGITQHIGAYSVEIDGRTMSFIDTPGHEAFTAMRARGAKVTDVVILVVAADDGVMPQTIEAVNHAKSADVPIIVAINKIDKADADKDKILRQLSEIGLVSEEWGGETLFADVSAKQKTGIKELLELVLLQADILELRADAEKRANGFVVEAVLDKGRGPVATLLVSEGTLSVGNFVVAGTTYGKVRALMDDRGNRVDSAGPAMPVEIMGLSDVPQAGERFYVVIDEKAAKEVVSHRETKERERAAAKNVKLKPTLENLFETLEEEEIKELTLIIKADTQGSVEAIKESVDKLGTDKCQVKIIHTGVGGISETDVNLASASNAIIVGFNVRPDAKAIEIAEMEGVSFELHTIIYNVIDRVKNAMEGLLDPIVKEKITGHAEVKETFSISKIGTIAGCMVSDGKVTRDSSLRVLRDGVIVFDGKIESLKRFKDDVKEVAAGFECGIGIERFNDIKVGDTFEFYSFEEHKQEL